MPTRTLSAALALAFALAACGGSGTAPSQPPPSQPPIIGTPTPPPPDPDDWERIRTRELVHGRFGLFRNAAQGTFAGVEYSSVSVGRPAASGTWVGSAIGHNCGREGCDPFEPYEHFFGTARITYNVGSSEVVVNLTDWRDVFGTPITDFLAIYEPATLTYNPTYGGFRARTGWPSNAIINVRFYGSSGNPSEALGTWDKPFFEAAFGATRQ